MKKKLKNYNQYLIAFILVNIILYLVICAGFKASAFTKEDFLKNGTIYSIFILVVFIANNIIESNYKIALIFFGKNNMPGNKVFSKLIYEENRILPEKVKLKYGELPIEAKEQNNLWYLIYSMNKNDEKVFQSHREFLLARDLCALSVTLIVIYFILILFNKVIFNKYYLGLIFVEYILLNIVSRNTAKRFVLNVIVTDISDIKNSRNV